MKWLVNLAVSPVPNLCKQNELSCLVVIPLWQSKQHVIIKFCCVLVVLLISYIVYDALMIHSYLQSGRLFHGLT